MPKDAEGGATRSRRTNKDGTKRKKKDPNAPKKALSSYMLFASEQRPKIIEENPGIAFGQVGKLLGEKWNAMTPDQKKPYDDKAALDKERYAKEMAAYNGTQL